MNPRSPDARARARAHLLEGADLRNKIIADCLDAILDAAGRITESLRGGGKVLFCGNGGSAAESQHFAAEFTNRFSGRIERPPIAALSLTTDTSFITAHANDYGFDTIFARQVEALGRNGDVLVGISTSGKSNNVVLAVEKCRSLGISTIGFLGGSGGRLVTMVDCAILVPDARTPHIQEGHIAVGHIVCELVETALLSSATP